tara:strand:+ start:83 stop:244 length:162 start_codon:yes stop_codon:yes gene_type:complete
MEATSSVAMLSQIWPIIIGIIGLIIILAKMHFSIEVLKEKVKTLFDLHNSEKK